MIAGLLFVLCLSAPAYSTTIGEAHRYALTMPQPEVYEFHLAKDGWLGYDKYVEHGVIPFLLTVAVDRITHAHDFDAEFRVFAWTSLAYLANEIKDGFGGWEQSHLLGDGFSIKDQVWAEAAILLALLIF